MDRTEKFLQNEFKRTQGNPEETLNMDQVLDHTHQRIRTRAIRRKTLFSAPIVVLLLLMVYVVMPENGQAPLLPGSELFMAGWESSWTEEQVLADSTITDDIYNQGIDYLIDESYYSYADEADDLIDESELAEFYGYLKEV